MTETSPNKVIKYLRWNTGMIIKALVQTEHISSLLLKYWNVLVYFCFPKLSTSKYYGHFPHSPFCNLAIQRQMLASVWTVLYVNRQFLLGSFSGHLVEEFALCFCSKKPNLLNVCGVELFLLCWRSKNLFKYSILLKWSSFYLFCVCDIMNQTREILGRTFPLFLTLSVYINKQNKYILIIFLSPVIYATKDYMLAW